MLYVASRPQIGVFTPVRADIMSLLPLTVIMCSNVVLVNLSLACSSIVCYQVVRILLTPLTAILNFCFYGSRIPFIATLALLPACAGVGIVTYYDSLPAAGKKLKMSSMQLLFNQMHVGAMLLAFSGQLMDTFPVWSQVSPKQWLMIFTASPALLLFFCLAIGGVHAEQINRAVPRLA